MSKSCDLLLILGIINKSAHPFAENAHPYDFSLNGIKVKLETALP